MHKNDEYSITPSKTIANEPDLGNLVRRIRQWGKELGFQQIGFSNTQLGEAEKHLNDWLNAGYQGSMSYMSRHGAKRYRPGELIPGTVTIISARMNYLPQPSSECLQQLKETDIAYIARYALGRDYHKLMRMRLKKLAEKIQQEFTTCQWRVFSDSAPVMEKAIAQKAGIGWIGKHSNLINKEDGSWFFLGEIYTDLDLPLDPPASNHCGDCQSCINSCPTQAIVSPYQVDSRRCISYLTIENRGAIPLQYRSHMKNRIYGCDDCQLACPWNRFESITAEKDYLPRHKLDASKLVELFDWSETDFIERTEGSAIRRIGYECWLRNIAVALGNANRSNEVITALKKKLSYPSALVVEHVQWALSQHCSEQSSKHGPEHSSTAKEVTK